MATNRHSWRSRWPQWSGYAASAWSLFYGVLGLYWTFGGAGFPFGVGHDPNPEYSVLGRVREEIAAPAIASLGFLGAFAACRMVRSRSHTSLLRAGLSVFAWTMAGALLLVIPDYRPLASIAYTLLLRFGIYNWTIAHQLLFIVGGFLWAATAIAYRRRLQHACGNCGRTGQAAIGWTTPASAARWGKRFTLAAVFIPMVYTVTRIAWAFDIPLLVSQAFLHQMNREFPGIWWFGAGLGLVEIGGSVLTMGLIRTWGETFPRWTRGLAGKRVPPALAIIPASLAAVVVTEAGLMIWRAFLMGEFGPIELGSIGTFGPALLWPLWGAALGAAALAYYYRRRGACRHCGQE